ncbi:MAG: DNA repair and recombination protein RadA [Thermoprotei archaeon]|nr:MAG: DNA repair and recombination protein RadA [Thermoprotei archaeon]
MEEIPVEVLKEYGVKSTTITRLKKAGIYDIRKLFLFNEHDLVDLGFGEDTAARLVALARKMMYEHGYSHIQSALEYSQVFDELECFTTGVKALDELLGGGVKVSESHELVGEYGAGKTQICHQLCVTVQLPLDRGGLQAKAVYIDTEGTFTPSRVARIAERFGLEPKEALKNIILVKPIKVSDLRFFVQNELPDIVLREKVKLVVLDSVIKLHRAEYRGRGKLAERQQDLNFILNELDKIQKTFGVAIVATNQVLANPGVFFGPTVKACGGHIVAHHFNHRFFIRKSKGNLRILECFDSPRIPPTPVAFVIKEDGLHDAELK